MGYIIKPLVTEKMTNITEKQNKFGLIVRPSFVRIPPRSRVLFIPGISIYLLVITAISFPFSVTFVFYRRFLRAAAQKTTSKQTQKVFFPTVAIPFPEL